MTLIFVFLILVLLMGTIFGLHSGQLTGKDPLALVILVIILLLLFAVFSGPRYGWWN
jgi:hypothetical protein